MIVVNSSTRQFNIPGADLAFGVESDSGSERKYFQCPRYVGNNLDVAGSFVRINYRNANGDIDSYLVNDLTVDGENVVFSWELYPKVTQYKGQVKFVLCVVGPDTRVKWHTTLGTGQVYEGLEPDHALVEQETSDVVAQLIAMVEAQTDAVEAEGAAQIKAVQTAAQTAQSAAVAEIEAKGVNTLGSIPADYTALSEAVDSLSRGRAGAIVCETEGSAITISDASDNYMQGLRIFGKSTQDGTPSPDAPVGIESVVEPVVEVCGKNLCDISKIYRSSANATFEKTDTTVRLVDTSGTNSYPAMYTKFILLPNTTYTASCDVTVVSGTAWLGFNVSSDGGVTYPNTNTWTSEKLTESGHITTTFTTTNSGYVRTKLFGENGNTSGCDVTYYNIQFERNDTETAYEPYSGQTLELTHTLPGIPVASGGNYTDATGQQWLCDEVDLERGVYVQRIGVVESYASEDISGAFMSTTGELTEGVMVLYILRSSVETPLSETEIASYRALHTNKPNTTILNDAGAHMAVAYSADTKLYIDNKIKEALK